ncbi:hypothetical protein DPMN_013108 [Dreissena polymorpha]|uniref:Uncharacterized protein n=1 Tax=Dreissena polymorpha TaxID=45954 RepID=A0A9D4N7A6_DREPO|nr:hypothetical protein DPMN_013108 [Dreissena polymorpha]
MDISPQVCNEHQRNYNYILGQQLERACPDRGESHPQRIFLEGTELLRVALLIQLSLPPSSRTSSTLLGLLSSPR